MSVRHARVIALLTGVGVVMYVGSWLVAGLWRAGYDPMTQAISELFEIGGQSGPRMLMVVALAVTGVMLMAFGPALHTLAPGHGLAAPVASVVAGVGTLLVPVFPCTAGCPGFGTTTTDSLHLVAAATGYIALIATPLLTAWRVRDHDRGFARWSTILGGVALVGFLIGATAEFVSVGGLIQRGYNTVADLWFVLAGLHLARGATVTTASEHDRNAMA